MDGRRARFARARRVLLAGMLGLLVMGAVPWSAAAADTSPDPEATADPTAELGDLAEYVLSPFAADEREEAERMIVRGAEAAEVTLRDGIARAMAQFNG